MAQTATVHARVDPEIKERATTALASMGLTVSSAVNMFLTRVAVEQALPFAVRVPNAATLGAMAEADAIAAGRARFHDADSLFKALESPGE